MAESLTIARPYAEAAFKAALDAQTLPAWSDMLSRLAAVVARPEAQSFIGNPANAVDNVAAVAADGADTFVSGTGVLRSPQYGRDYAAAIAAMRRAAEAAMAWRTDSAHK